MRSLRLSAGLVLALLGTLGVGALRLPVAPDFFLLPVADAARGGGAVAAMIAGLLAGGVEDLLTAPGRLLGLHAFSKILIGYLLATIGARTVVEKPIAVGGVLAGAVVFESLVLAFLFWVLRGEALFPRPVALLARALATGLIGGVLHAASRVPWKARREARRRLKLE